MKYWLLNGTMNNRYLYIGDEQYPICKIFNEKANWMPESGTKRKSQWTYSKNNEGIGLTFMKKPLYEGYRCL